MLISIHTSTKYAGINENLASQLLKKNNKKTKKPCQNLKLQCAPCSTHTPIYFNIDDNAKIEKSRIAFVQQQ